MAFIELDNATPAKVTVPAEGVVVGPRMAGRGDTKTRYMAIGIGAKVAKALGFTFPEQSVSVRAGTGDDVGRIAISGNVAGKFRAKRQKAGHYLLTVSGNAIGGRYALDFEKFVIDAVRFVPAAGTNGPMIIIKCPEAMRAVG